MSQDAASVGTLGRERDNPYVGPRSLGRGDPIYGRNREISELASTLVAERIVLLYSPSGAGKTSLLEAGLRPELERREFRVLPTIRIGSEPPDTLGGAAIRNRYVLSVLTSLEEGRPAPVRMQPSELATVTLAEYFDQLVEDSALVGDPCFIFDQFEELFTLDPTDQEAKADFLGDLGVALRHRGRWALFSMREDLIAQLDPFLALVPNRFAVRYRLDLLAPDAAMLAARRTAADAGVDFTTEAAALLIDDLRRVRVQRGGRTIEEPGPSIEPVQLQVACRQLWATLDPHAQSIRAEDVIALGSVDNALGDFYASQVRAVADRAGASEREIRRWFDEELITESGFRTQVLQGPEPHGKAVLQQLENAHLIRAERRRGTEWYELAHDRLIEPIRANNAAWGQSALGTLQREAQTWEHTGRPAGRLLTGPQLAEAEDWAQQHPSAMLPIDADFLNASRAEQRRADLEQKATRWKLIGATTISVLALAAVAIVGLLYFASVRGERDAQRGADLALSCAGGDNADCDELFEVGGNEEFARTCGDRSIDRIPGGTCAETSVELRGNCGKGDWAACDDLYRLSGTDSEDQAFAATCGRDAGAISAGECDATEGGKEVLELRDACSSGDMAACDELYWLSPVDSEYEEFGATCGDRIDLIEGGNGTCDETDGGATLLPFTHGDDAELDALWNNCEGGDADACDQLYFDSPSGSEYEEFGLTCGNRTDGSQDSCAGVLTAS